MFGPLLHPLIGATPASLCRALWRHGGLTPRRMPLAVIAILIGILRWPNCQVEAIRTRHAARIKLDPPPVFIVGHWRSGTTLLHNILSRDQSFCFPRLIDVLSPHEFFPSPLEGLTHPLIYRLLPPTRPMDDVPLHPDFPQEEELALAAMAAPSFLNCIYFPKDFMRTFQAEVLLQSGPGTNRLEEWRSAYRYYLGKVALRYPGRRLLLKNPANSARMRALFEVFPDAKFIHIHRHPIDVFGSMSKFFDRMLSQLALQKYDHAQVSEWVLHSYPLLMMPLLRDCATLSPRQLITVPYAELIASPSDVVQRIYRQLELPFASSAAAAIDAFLAETPVIAPPRSKPPDGVVETVFRAWEPFFRQLGYARDPLPTAGEARSGLA